MPLSRRGLFSILAGAPAAAVGMVALPAKGEQTKITVTIDDSDFRDFVRATVQRDAVCIVHRHKAERGGEWRF